MIPLLLSRISERANECHDGEKAPRSLVHTVDTQYEIIGAMLVKMGTHRSLLRTCHKRAAWLAE